MKKTSTLATTVLVAVVALACLVPAPAAKAASVIVAWDSNPEPDIAGYRIYVGNTSGVYTTNYSVGLVNQLLINDLVYDTPYVFMATAFNQAGLESLPSNEITYTPRPPVPPTVPVGLAASNRGRGKAGITFTYTDASAAGFRVYTNNVFMLYSAKPAASLVTIDLPNLAPKIDYSVQASAVGTNTLESAKSLPVIVKIPGNIVIRRE